MRGIFSSLPADTLAAALAPIAERCAQLDWVVDLQGGPVAFPYYDEAHPDNVVAYHRREPASGPPIDPMHWFERGFLPRYADRLVLDEWGCYLGFDSRVVPPAALARLVGRDLSPRPALFNALVNADLLYVLRVDTGWWEAYTTDEELLERLRLGWGGRDTSSERWDDRSAPQP